MIERDTSDKKIKFIIGFFSVAYVALGFNMLNLQVSNFNYGTVYAPTFDDVCPSYIQELVGLDGCLDNLKKFYDRKAA